MGFGGYSPTAATPVSEYSEPGSFDMAPYEGNHYVRIGTKNNDGEPLGAIRKMVVFKGVAISETSTSPSIDDVLNCKWIDIQLDSECPKIIVSATQPACTELYAYYTLQPSSLASSNQQVLDSSGNNLHAVNGATSGAEATDATR